MDLVNIKLGQGLAVGLLGYAVVFFGLILLMLVVMALAKYFISKAKKEAAVPSKTVPAAAPASVPAAEAPKAPGSAGDIKLYDTNPRDAAMIMAIVADKMGKPVNELRFKSIKEVK